MRKINEKKLLLSLVLIALAVGFAVKAYLFTVQSERFAFVIISMFLFRFAILSFRKAQVKI